MFIIGPPPQPYYSKEVIVSIAILPGENNHTEPERYSPEGPGSEIFMNGTTAIIGNMNPSKFMVRLEKRA